MSTFKLTSTFSPTGDQPRAIKQLTTNLKAGAHFQTLLGITGSGKTFALANVLQNIKKPVLILSPNKTLAAQLYEEFKTFFPKNNVQFFISYYDYYQPEAYIPSTDTYINKDAKINKFIEELRHDTVTKLLTNDDVIVIASVSAIYDLGSPTNFEKESLIIHLNDKFTRPELAKRLILLQYSLKNINSSDSGFFRYRENNIEVFLANGNEIIEIELKNSKIKSITRKPNEFINHKSSMLNIEDKRQFNPENLTDFTFYPAKLFTSDRDKLDLSILNIKKELKEQLKYLKSQKKMTEFYRLKSKVAYDIDMLESTGYCNGIENYSKHLSFKKTGEPPFTLLDYFHSKFNDDFLVFIDESHISIPQIQSMYAGNFVRKSTLVNYGFRLPSAIDNRPLTFKEFEEKVPQTIFVSATPRQYEIKKSEGNIVEQLIRPTGIIDPQIIIRPCKTQIPDLIKEVQLQVKNNQQTLILTLTKKSAEDLSEYLINLNIKTKYLHSDIKPLERPEILKQLRSGKINVLIGVNLLREGLDLPEVSLIAILDADKEGFLRNRISLLQAIGRVARNVKGKAILYADHLTDSIKETIKETDRRRKHQLAYNRKNHITAKTIEKEINSSLILTDQDITTLAQKNSHQALIYLEKQLENAVQN